MISVMNGSACIMEEEGKHAVEVPEKAGPCTLDYSISSSEYESDSSEEDSQISVSKNLNENYEDEIETAILHQRDRKKAKENGDEQSKKAKRKRTKLPAHLKGLMGEANLRFARGDASTAESMCLEIIRQEPYAYEPYQTMSRIYDLTDKQKSVEFLIIAAHLNPKNPDRWVELANYYYKVKENIRGAITCYTRAIRAKPRNYDFHLKRIELLEELEDFKSAIRCKAQLLHNYSRKMPLKIVELSKELTVYYHKEKDYAKAVDIYSVPFTKCKKLVTHEMINKYIELLLLNKSYAQCLDIFVQFCNIEIEVIVGPDNKVRVDSCLIPEGIHVDLLVKFIICIVRLDSEKLIDNLIQPIIEGLIDVEINGDLYLDIAEALMSTSHHAKALKLLIPLIKSNAFSLAAVWLKYAECLRECKMTNESIAAFYHVVELAPSHLDVRHPLADLLLQEGRTEDALKVMHQDESAAEIDVELIIKNMELLMKHKKIKEYFDSFELLLRRHCVTFSSKDELRQVTFQETMGEKILRINRLREVKGVEPIAFEVASVREPSVEEEYELFRSVLSFCYKNKYFKELKKYCFYGLCSHRFKAYVHDITLVAMIACLQCRDNDTAFPIIRDLLVRKTDTPNFRLWNLYNIAVQTPDIIRQTRFLMRQSKTNKNEFFKLIESCIAISSGSYRIASIYLLPYLKNESTPFVCLMLGIIFLQISCQKYRDLKKKTTQSCYGFFANYAKKRGKDALPEVYYNMARMYHQYGVVHLAVHYYKLVLEFKHPLYDKHVDILDLTQEAAYNLCLIYSECDNHECARRVMHKYLTIE